MNPLKIRLRDYIADHPGTEFDKVIQDVVDFRHEKASEAERILIANIATKRIVAFEEYDVSRDGIYQYLYLGVVPDFVSVDESIDARILRCIASKPGIDMMAVANDVSGACVEPVSKVLVHMFDLIRGQKIYTVGKYSPEARKFVNSLYPIDKIPSSEVA